jgi:serpin B
MRGGLVFRGEIDTLGDMQGRVLGIASLVAIGVAGGCASTRFNASTVDGAVKASNAFGFDFYRQIRKGRDNFVCSPAGAAIALTMAAAGARGETQAEMLRALHIAPANLDQTYASYAAVLAMVNVRDGRDGLVLTMADRAWVDKSLTLVPAYQALLSDVFRAPIVQLDFAKDKQAALATINQWSSDETHGRIPKILDRVTGPLVLANAIYMLGEWQSPFAASATGTDRFTTAAGSTSTIMMRQLSDFRFAQVGGTKLVELPYKGGLSMILVLPQAVDGLERVEDEIPNSYTDWLQALSIRTVDVKLPRFTTKTNLDLLAPLRLLGIEKAFGSMADFSGIDGTRELFIGQVVQKAWIETSEKGTEAAAVTAIEFIKESTVEPPPPPVVFHADHPFMYLIRDTESGEILFMGRVVKPST